jgi:chromosomal replication initiation ATPase DnaA
MHQQFFPFPYYFDYSPGSWIDTEGQKLAWQALSHWPNWMDPTLIIYGPSFSGKTHLCHLWQDKSKGTFYKIGDPLPSGPLIIDELTLHDLTETLFHFLNRLREEKRPCLMTAQTDPREWPAPMADLSSRLKALISIPLEEPQESEQILLLHKILTDMQITLSPYKLHRLMLHRERSYEGIKKLVYRILDRGSR